MNCYSVLLMSSSNISTHAPRTGSDHVRRPDIRDTSISTHAPRTGSDYTASDNLEEGEEDFNPRSPHGERPASGPASRTARSDFNPRSRTGSEPDDGERLRHRVISTHAPARGATETADGEERVVRVFQPTLPHGERHYLLPPYLFTSVTFQPTLPHGERLCLLSCTAHCIQISTHAPARGATRIDICANR